DLQHVLEHWFGDALGGVHILPPYPSNADGGFSPLTHREIDPAYGTWETLHAIAARWDLSLDLTLNHISDASEEFRDYVARGRDSPYADLFVDVDRFGALSPEDLARIHIRKEKDPFRTVHFADGTTGRVWCTFTEHQIDLNYDAPQTTAMIEGIIAFLAAQGVKLIRLDAFGYTIKRAGTSCFLVEPEVFQLLDWVAGVARAHGADVLPEVHDHPSYQHAISMRGMRPYGFAMPPLVLHALLRRDGRPLRNWLRMCPRNQVNVLDTHDGICLPDVEGLLSDADIEALVDDISGRGGDPILRRQAGNAHSVGAIYQITCTIHDALKGDDDAHLAARALQLFAPGIPQVYYVGALGEGNDPDLAEQSGEPRDINRHHFTLEEVEVAMHRPFVQRLLGLMRLRSGHPAFHGRFELVDSARDAVAMRWTQGSHQAGVHVDLATRTTT
ncbi:MAG: sucrose phosphorylase, partial [Myxococcales bacterium]|nr:sucrose phosphorylase [Myxococcales bacterium]